MWLKAYVAYMKDGELTVSGHRERNIRLYCPWVSGYLGPITDFGKDDGESGYVPGRLASEG